MGADPRKTPSVHLNGWFRAGCKRLDLRWNVETFGLERLMMTKRGRAGAAAVVTVTALCGAIVASGPSGRADGVPGLGPGFLPGNLVVSGSFYTPDPGIVAGKTQLPPGCTTGCVTATAGGTYPQVFNNDLVDANFGVTSRVFLSQLTPSGRPLGTFAVPANQLVTSFSSKSELALNLSPDRRTLSFMGYVARPDQVDVSNSNTPGVVDPTNPVPGAFYRAAAQAVRRRADAAHRDQRLQRQQRPGGDHRRGRRQAADLHGGQRR
jgi:hypothetical protein